MGGVCGFFWEGHGNFSVFTCARVALTLSSPAAVKGFSIGFFEFSFGGFTRFAHLSCSERQLSCENKCKEVMRKPKIDFNFKQLEPVANLDTKIVSTVKKN